MKRVTHESNSLTEKRCSAPKHKLPAGGKVDAREGVHGRQSIASEIEGMHGNSSNQRPRKGSDRV